MTNLEIQAMTLKQMQAHIELNDLETYQFVSKRSSIWKSKKALSKWVDLEGMKRLNEKMAQRPNMRQLP